MRGRFFKIDFVNPISMRICEIVGAYRHTPKTHECLVFKGLAKKPTLVSAHARAGPAKAGNGAEENQHPGENYERNKGGSRNRVVG